MAMLRLFLHDGVALLAHFFIELITGQQATYLSNGQYGGGKHQDQEYSAKFFHG